MYKCVHVYMCGCVGVGERVHAYMCGCGCACVQVRLCGCGCACICVHVCVYKCVVVEWSVRVWTYQICVPVQYKICTLYRYIHSIRIICMYCMCCTYFIYKISSLWLSTLDCNIKTMEISFMLQMSYCAKCTVYVLCWNERLFLPNCEHVYTHIFLRRVTQVYAHVCTHAQTHIFVLYFPDERGIYYIFLGVECSFPLAFHDCFCLRSKVFETSIPFLPAFLMGD